MLLYITGVTPSAEIHAFEVEEGVEDLASLKRLIADEFGLSWDRHDLFLEGTVLGPDCTTLSSLAIEAGCELSVRANTALHATRVLSDSGIAVSSDLLTRACHANDINSVKLVVQAGADLEKEHEHNLGLPLSVSCREGNEQIVSLLLHFGADPNKADSTGRTPFAHLAKSTASHAAQRAVFMNLRRNGADINIKDNLGHTPLHHAILSDNRAFILEVLSPEDTEGCGPIDVDLNIQDGLGRTVLMLMCSKRYPGVLDDATLVVGRGALLEVEDVMGCTALFYAVGSPGLVELLLREGAVKESVDLNRHNVLTRAVQSNDPVSVLALLRAGCQPDTPTPPGTLPPEGGAPLLHACRLGHEEVAKLLVQHGADTKATDDEGKTVLEHCRTSGIRIL